MTNAHPVNTVGSGIECTNVESCVNTCVVCTIISIGISVKENFVTAGVHVHTWHIV
ncbi:hypothetical protein SDC9_75998 [bioreactor metagenome]|uniref:Uncharacterized protein n=1 Tax=bioreactor metagenome TaxID=1076179 RepID=A0A644YN91_9ZZZZ